MNKYEKLLAKLPKDIYVDDQATLKYNTQGYYTNEFGIDLILINKRASINEKACLLMEEVGHYYNTVGDITDQSKVENKKQEIIARRWAYKKLVDLKKIIKASKEGIRNRHELAEYLGVTEAFLQEALYYYRDKYGIYYTTGKYIICFEPLGVIEKFF